MSCIYATGLGGLITRVNHIPVAIETTDVAAAVSRVLFSRR